MSLANIGIKDIVINFDEHELEDLVIVQGDTGTRGFRVTLTDNNGEIIPASTEYELRLIGVNSNYPDKAFYTVAEIEDDNYLARISSDMASAKGILSIQLALYEGNKRLIHTRIWDLQVNKALSQGGEIGKDLVVDFTLLAEAIERTEALEKIYITSLEEQATIKSDIDNKHTEVTDMHTNLQTVFDTENERIAAEQARATAETARQTAEDDRLSSETTRKANETDRQGKEAVRQSSESGRVSAENARSTEETARNNAENARATAEASRATEETKRKNNEEARQDAEVIREQNEEARVSTQSQRDATWTTWQELIEDGILPPATESVKGVMYLDATDEDKKHESAVSFGAYEAVVEHQNNKLNNKVDKIEGMSLSQNSYTTLEKEKLATVERGATKYIHPDKHDAAIISETDTKKFVSNSQISAWDSKAEGSHSHSASDITESNTRKFVTQTEKDKISKAVQSLGANNYSFIAVPTGTDTSSQPDWTIVLEYNNG